LGRKRVTLADVASAAGVSGTTASLVLSGRGDELRISPTVQQRVREASAALGYRPNIVSIGLRNGSSRTLGFVSDTVATSQLAGDMIKGALETARAHGFMLFIGETEGDPELERQLLDAMLDRQVDGIVLASMFTRTRPLPSGLDQVPAILLNALPEQRTTSIPAVIPDELTAGRAAAQLLLDAGHRSVHLVGAGPGEHDVPPGTVAGVERLAGIRETLHAAGLELASGHLASEWEPRVGWEATHRLLEEWGPGQAIITLNDRLAFGAYQAIQEARLTVPGDVSVVSFDDAPLAQWLRPGLTTFAIPHHDLGRRAVELLVEQIGADGATTGTSSEPVSADRSRSAADRTHPAAVLCAVCRCGSSRWPAPPHRMPRRRFASGTSSSSSPGCSFGSSERPLRPIGGSSSQVRAPMTVRDCIITKGAPCRATTPTHRRVRPDRRARRWA